ncbi:MAG: inositol monophosphatase [Bacteroidales bacterium]|nr:inositol monophosphatase [Bacteroidales bacterium]
MIPENTREILESALKKGGTVLLEHFGKPSETFVKESISSVVTEADLASEKVIIEFLGASTEPYNIISEESGYIENHSIYTWVIDPLDGTSNFAAGLPWFGVIITLFHEQVPIQAAMYLPVADQLYYAESGKGAWRNGSPIKTLDSTELTEILLSYSFDFSRDPGKTDAEMDLLSKLSNKIRNTRSTNSLIDFCYTTDGRLGAAINQTTKIWDIAAPWLIIREAGGVVTDIFGSEIQFNLSQDEINRNYTIVAAGSGIHGQIIRIINNQL